MWGVALDNHCNIEGCGFVGVESETRPTGCVLLV